MDPLVEGSQIPRGFRRAAHIGADGSEEVPVRHHAAECLLLVHHQQVVKVHGVEDLFDDLQTIVHLDGDDPRRHYTAQIHRHALLELRWRLWDFAAPIGISTGRAQRVWSTPPAVPNGGVSSSSSSPSLYKESSSLSTRMTLSGLRVSSYAVWSTARLRSEPAKASPRSLPSPDCSVASGRLSSVFTLPMFGSIEEFGKCSL